MIRPQRLLVAAGIIMDIITVVDTWPPRGGDVFAKEGQITPGGGFNLVAAAHRLGCPTAYVGRLGQGAFSSIARRHLETMGVAFLGKPVADSDTGFTVAIVEADGERTFLTVSGAESMMSKEHLRSIAIEDGDALYISGYHLVREPFASAVMDWVERQSARIITVFDPGPLVVDISPSVRRRLLGCAHILTVNFREASILTGEKRGDEAVRRLSRLLAPTARAIVRVGSEGAWILDDDGRPRLIPTRAVPPRDTSGAGDVHTAALIARLHSHMEWERAVYEANVCASYTVEKALPSASPTEVQLEELLLNLRDQTEHQE